MKIIIIDDETALTDALARFLTSSGHLCVSASRVRGAIESIDEHRPDLVITDLHLPDGNGFDIIRHVHQTLPHAHVILMTANHMPGLEQASLKAGAAAYLRKPFSLADLKNAVETAPATRIS